MMEHPIVPLAPEHAAEAAAVHAEGQPGTFLTSLGTAFLRALYAELVSSPHCFGFVALDQGSVVGVVVATTNSRLVFREVVLRHGFRLAMPVARAILRQPRLFVSVLQTLFYPSRIHLGPGEAEWLYWGVRKDHRRRGIGRSLFGALMTELRRRRVRAVGLVVDGANTVARRFYEENGIHPIRSFVLYGREMYWYMLRLKGGEGR